MPKHYFLIPAGLLGRQFAGLDIGGEDGKPTDRVSADHYMKLMDDFESQRQAIKMLEITLTHERNKILRLMAALADEVVSA